MGVVALLGGVLAAAWSVWLTCRMCVVLLVWWCMSTAAEQKLARHASRLTLPAFLPTLQDKATYEQWKAGLRALLNMIMAPGPIAAAAGGGPGGGRSGALSVQRSLVRHALGMSGNSEQPQAW
jgi:hypothetical protein